MVLTYLEARETLQRAGIPFDAEVRVADTDQALAAAAAEIGFPLVLKANVESSVHKLATGAVKLGCRNVEDVLTAAAGMRAKLGSTGDTRVVFLLERERSGILDLLLGAHVDRQFGPVVIFGVGGTGAEALDDNALDILPLADGGAGQLLSRTKVGRAILDGQIVDADRVLAMLDAFTDWYAQNWRTYTDVDLNPIRVVDRETMIALDARLIEAVNLTLSPTDLRPTEEPAMQIDDLIAELSRHVGVDFEVQADECNNTEGTRDNFRHYAMAAGDLNPLWVDGDHARTGPNGEVVAPPGWLSSVIRPAHSVRRVVPTTCDVLDAEVQWRFHENVRLGEGVIARGRLVEVVRKTTKALGDCALATGVMEYTDANGQLLATARSTIFVYPRDEGRAGKRPGPSGSTAAAPEPATPIVRRGTQARYWDDLEMGQEIPRVRRQALTEREIIQWFIGSHMWLLESSARHFNAAAAQQTSVPAAFDIGTQRTAWLAQLVTDWAGDDAQLVELTCRFRGLIFVGDAPELGGQVESLSEENGEHLATLSLWVKNGAGTTVSPATAVVRLPRRD